MTLATRLVRLSVLLLMVVAPAETVDAQAWWPEFLGPQGNGQTEETGLPITWSETENVRWKTAIHGRGWSSPVIWGNQIWLTTATPDGKEMFVIGVDRASGKILHDIKLFDNESPTEVHSLNSYASATPVIEAGRVYVHYGSFGTACIDTKTGETLWTRRDLPCFHFRGPGSSPILHGDLLIIHFDGFDYQYVVALNKQTGETVWKQDRDIDFGTDNGDFKKAFCTPSVINVDGREQLISPASKAALAYDPQTGEEIWRIRFAEFSPVARPVFGSGLVFINTGFGKAQLIAVRPGEGDITDSHIVWRQKQSVPSKTSQLVVDGLLYMIHDSGVATCLEAESGKIVWRHRIGGNFSSTPLYAEGRLYFFNQEGVATVIEAGREFKPIAENTLDSGFMASPAVAEGALYLRTEKHLYRIEK